MVKKIPTGDFIEADIENPEQDVAKTLLREDLEGVLATLSPRERDVLRLRMVRRWADENP